MAQCSVAAAVAVVFPWLLGVGAFQVSVQRPASNRWTRTQCGGPSGAAEIPSKWASQVSPSTTPLPAYPRPQMARGDGSGLDLRENGDPASWFNLNGLWEWERATSGTPPFGRTLRDAILVPFPVESCLSGVAPQRSADIVKEMWYRLSFDHANAQRTLLHFGAVDWQTRVYLNKVLLGNHTGGYDGFSFDITDSLQEKGNELLIYVFDPSDSGAQPNGKQRISAIDKPGGDTYTPSSGIWQTVWLESVPKTYITSVKIDQASTSSVSVQVSTIGVDSLSLAVMDGDAKVATVQARANTMTSIEVPSPKLWSPSSPYLYDLKITAGSDTVVAYFGLRTFAIGKSASNVTKPMLNGKPVFLAGFLDQSWWPDGQYTAPTDEALESDLLATKMFGFNMIRLHQKVNPERWYYHADRHGLVIFQDMIQKYGGANSATIPLFVQDLKAMLEGRGNHPSIVQWTTFNEGDCWNVFKTSPYDVAGIVKFAKALDPSRLVDTDSGGGANKFGVADVNDIHSYPNPGDPKPSDTQYAMVGEFGGIGAFIKGKEWVPGACHTYLKASSPDDEASKYLHMAKSIKDRVDHLGASVYTQTTDVELECDGFLNYDRSNKFSEAQTKALFEANQALINAAADGVVAHVFV